LWTAAHEARRAGVPYVVSPRGMLEKDLVERKSLLLKASLIGFIEKHTLEGAAAIHVTSRREAEEAAAFGFHLRLVREIANGVDVEAGTTAPSHAIQEVVSGPPFILFLGRINWKKGLDRLIAALPHADGVRLVIAGNDEDGYRGILDGLARTVNVIDRIRFAGPVAGADKAVLLGAATALVLPSYSENFGNVVLEAMAAGRPVIVTPEVGIAELVQTSGSGVVVEGGPEPLGNAMARLIADASTANAMGARGHAVAQRYSWDAVAAQMEDLYREIGR
jgi:glycosyltransferase involved in cell wall biosynthesis